MSNPLDDQQISHLEMVQGVINRMAANSFTIKGWTATILSAIFAFAAKDTDPCMVSVAYVPVLAFWYLDAYYLRLEKLFRFLHDDIRLKSPDSFGGLFCMDTRRYADKVSGVFKIAFCNRSIVLYHGSLFVSVVIATLFIWRRA